MLQQENKRLKEGRLQQEQENLDEGVLQQEHERRRKKCCNKKMRG